MDRFAGVTVMEFRVALVTVSEAMAVIVPDVAVIVEEPATSALASPLVGTVSLIVATVVEEEVHVAMLVTSFELPSVNVPVAVNCVVVVGAIETEDGLMTIETSVGTGAVTVNVAVPLTPPEVAVIVEVPGALLVARPPAPMVAVAALEELHVAELVRFWVEPSE